MAVQESRATRFDGLEQRSTSQKPHRQEAISVIEQMKLQRDTIDRRKLQGSTLFMLERTPFDPGRCEWQCRIRDRHILIFGRASRGLALVT
jgi:hypothetical protein